MCTDCELALSRNPQESNFGTKKKNGKNGSIIVNKSVQARIHGRGHRLIGVATLHIDKGIEIELPLWTDMVVVAIEPLWALWPLCSHTTARQCSHW